MDDAITKAPPAIVPVYSMRAPNETIQLYSGNMTLKTPTGQLSGSGVVEFIWLPTPRTVFRMNFAGSLAVAFGDNDYELTLDALSSSHKVWILDAGSRSGVNECGGQLGMPVHVGERSNVRYAVFHLPNFAEYIGDWVTDGQACWRGRVVYETADWTVTLDQVPNDTGDMFKLLNPTRGYGLTHVGRVVRRDGQVFDLQDAEDVLRALGLLFTFTRGIRVTPVLRVGYGIDDRQKCWDWTAYNMDPWAPQYNWHASGAKLLGPTLDAVLQRLRDPVWEQPLTRAVKWYVEAYDMPLGSDTGIVFVQVALELLAWTLLIEEAKAISRKGFENLPAADRIRLMLARCGIPLEIPASCAELTRVAKQQKWQDGPQAFTEVRNALVHATPAKRAKLGGINGGAWHDVWNLGMWYTELTLLRVLGYNGTYGNRLRSGRWAGQVEPVPWASKPPQATT
jgi:hypothetical protein